MKVSFVIPAFNEAARIKECLESILKEVEATKTSHPNLVAEVIVVNNASTDNTGEIAQSVLGVRVVNESRKGLVMARQAGFEVCTGELIANIDADVMLPKGWLTRVLSEFEHNKHLVTLSGPFIYYDLTSFERALVKVFYLCAFFLYLVNRFILRVGSMVQGGNFVLRRDALIQAGGYDTSITFYGEDTDVAKRMSKFGAVKWSFKLPVYTSGRRLKGEGIVVTSMRYTVNYFWVTFFGKPFTHRYKDIRPE